MQAHPRPVVARRSRDESQVLGLSRFSNMTQRGTTWVPIVVALHVSLNRCRLGVFASGFQKKRLDDMDACMR
jgi:hypothetical protein